MNDNILPTISGIPNLLRFGADAKVIILIDYDNLDRLERQRGTRYVITRLLDGSRLVAHRLGAESHLPPVWRLVRRGRIFPEAPSA